MVEEKELKVAVSLHSPLEQWSRRPQEEPYLQ